MMLALDTGAARREVDHASYSPFRLAPSLRTSLDSHAGDRTDPLIVVGAASYRSGGRRSVGRDHDGPRRARGRFLRDHSNPYPSVDRRHLPDRCARYGRSHRHPAETWSSPLDAFTLNVRTLVGRQGGIIYARQSNTDPRFWEATHVFPVPGEWAIVITKPTWGNRYPDPCTGAGVVLTVLPANNATPTASPIASPAATPMR